MTHVHVNGVDLEYVDEGTGAPVVFSHGAASRRGGRAVLELARPGGDLRAIARVAVPRLADSCSVYLAVEGTLERVASVDLDRKLEEAMADLPVRVFDSGEPVLERTGVGSLLLVPIVAREHPLGVIALGVRVRERFHEQDLELAQELSRRAADAIDNARLVRELERRAQAAQALEFVGAASSCSTGRASSGCGIPRPGGSRVSPSPTPSEQPRQTRWPDGRSTRSATVRRRFRWRLRTESCGSRSRRPGSPTVRSSPSAT